MADRGTQALLAGRYALGPVIGRGGMGDVHAAHDERLGRAVAVKLLRDDLARRPELRTRFEAEALAAARLSHPHVVAIYDTGETDDGIPYIVMECLPGRTLGDEMEEGPLEPERLRQVAAHVLSALDAAHGAGIVHRDVKPGNILIAESGDVKVADFGIAKSIDDDQTTGVVLGTAAYVPPERLAGERATPAGDLYSFGVVLYEAAAGRKPFVADSPIGVVRAVQRGEAAPLEGVADAVMRGVIERSMAKEPARRFSSAREMAAALEHAPATPADDATVPVRAPTETMKLPEPPARTGPVRSHTRPHREGARTRRPLVIGALAAMFVAAFAVALVSQSGDDAPVDSAPGSSAPVVTSVSTPSGAQLPATLERELDRLEESIGG